ncbi:flagellar hook protein FlgE [Buchnera aphidicola]|uniref:flagellar hook protein FlgE n=1 Tax=Buchnera aphidicola TaxID=9 RepID=UPI00346470E1
MSIMNAISGLMASSNYIDVISNNIANASTTGFKSSTISFCDIVEQSRMAKNFIGAGTARSNLVQNFNNGPLINTGRDLDIGINQEGFFRVVDSHGRAHYTRNGQFSLDKNKNIVNMQGLYLTGQNKDYANSNKIHSMHLIPINLKKKFILLAKPTTKINFSPVLNDTHIDDQNDNTIIPYNTSFTIYDKYANPQKIDIMFEKDKKESNTWKAYINSRNINDNSLDHKIEEVFTMKFNDQGQLTSPSVFMILKTSKNFLHQSITLDLTGTVVKQDSKLFFDPLFQDGYSEGVLKTFDILDNGEIMGTYSNQKIFPIGQIILAKFINPVKLRPEGSNLWASTVEAGSENLGIAGSMGFGSLRSKNLESSNVDLNKELLNMIIAQRNYQSNAQVLKTEDKILNTLVNLR